MKRSLIFVLLVVLCFTLVACTPKPAPAPEKPIEQPEAPSSNAQEPSQNPQEDPSEQPQDQESDLVAQATADVEVMMPIMDSIIRSVGNQGAEAYKPDDLEYTWTLLYLIGQNWGQSHPDVTMDEDYVTIIPTKVMQEFASAAFANFEQLQPIPEDLQETIKYDEESDSYLLSPSDAGATSTKLEQVIIEASSGLKAVVTYGSEFEDELIGTYEFTLNANPQRDNNSVYKFTVTDFTFSE